MRVRSGVAFEDVRTVIDGLLQHTRSRDVATTAHNYYVDESRKLLMSDESYTDAAGMVEHLENMDPDVASRLMELVDLVEMRVYGGASPELRSLLSSFGTAHYFDYVTGFRNDSMGEQSR